jgi:hypothetical protein
LGNGADEVQRAGTGSGARIRGGDDRACANGDQAVRAEPAGAEAASGTIGDIQDGAVLELTVLEQEEEEELEEVSDTKALLVWRWIKMMMMIC